MPAHDSNKPGHAPAYGRNPLFIIGGMLLLGLALALLLFGSRLLGVGETAAEPTVLEQVPSLDDPGGTAPKLASGPGPLAVGDQAFDFTLLDLEGNELSLASLRGRPVILNFWATWCAPCRVEMPELQAAYEAYQDDDLAILALNQQESPEVVRDFFTHEMGLTFTPLLDSEGAVASLYGANRTLPTSIIINGDGIIIAIHRGPMAQSQVAGYLAETVTRDQ